MCLRVYELEAAKDLEAMDWFIQLRRSAMDTRGEAAQAVAKIIQNVQSKGDQAVVDYMRQWTDPGFSKGDIRIPTSEMTEALERLDAPLRGAFEKAIEQVRAYQQHLKPDDPETITLGGARLGLRFTPVSSVGLAVPGGKAAYPSTVIMLAVPAMVAGVAAGSISVVTPPPTRTGNDRGDGPGADPGAGVSPLVLAVCAMLGIERVYRIGGAQGLAALALGTQSVERVDMIVGPGNVYTQLAKLQLGGHVGIDGFYGPSEILTIADESADPARIAADLVAQAEHDPGRCFLIAWSRGVIEQVNEQIAKQLAHRKRRGAIETALREGSAALLVKDESVAVSTADRIAAEHVNLAVAAPEAWLDRLRHGGEYFLGDGSPVAAGDYIAGPSHCLPTGTTARFASGVSVYTFLKRSGTIEYPSGMPQEAIDAAAQIAEAEGLDGHAASLRIRGL